MHIRQPNQELDYISHTRDVLVEFIQQPLPSELPPCMNCKNHIPQDCTSKCKAAPAALSSDPIKFPLEKTVVPIVFELMSTRVIQPCWSCEGHFNHLGELWKIPQINFYSDSPIYPQLLLRYLKSLSMQKRLSYEWHIVIADFGQSWSFSYSLEPNLNGVSEPRLGNLQQDLTTISTDLCQNLKSIAQKMLDETKQMAS